MEYTVTYPITGEWIDDTSMKNTETRLYRLQRDEESVILRQCVVIAELAIANKGIITMWNDKRAYTIDRRPADWVNNDIQSAKSRCSICQFILEHYSCIYNVIDGIFVKYYKYINQK